MSESEEKPNPFIFLNSVSENKEYVLKDDPSRIKDYPQHLINKGLSLYIDTIMFANDMNEYHKLDHKMQYDYYFHAIRKGKRRSKWPKKLDRSEEHSIIQTHYKYNDRITEEVLKLLNDEQIAQLRRQ